MFNRTFPDWQDKTAVVMASGHSLTRDQADHAVNHAWTIAVNSTWELAPFADAIYGGDLMWWKTHIAKVQTHVNGKGAGKWTCDRSAAERWGLSWVKGVNRLGLSRGPHINTNGNSGAQAINLAYLFGARRILLLGFDMKLGPGGEKHWHPDHPSPCVQSQTFEEWIRKLDIMAPELEAAGCEVINCTPGSALHCFPMSTIEKELP